MTAIDIAVYKRLVHRAPLPVICVLLLATTAFVRGQQALQPDAESSSISSLASLEAFQKQRQELAGSLSALLARNPGPQQLQAWQSRHAAALASQQEFAEELGAQSALEPMPAVEPNIPADASPKMKDFLAGQAAMANARAQIHSQLVDALPLEVTVEQVRAMGRQEMELFQQQHADDLKAQEERIEALGRESTRQPVPEPPPLVVPTDASPQMAAMLMARDGLMREQIAFFNQYATASPTVCNAAVAQWMQQNAARMEQMQQLSQDLSSTSQKVPSL